MINRRSNLFQESYRVGEGVACRDSWVEDCGKGDTSSS